MLVLCVHCLVFSAKYSTREDMLYRIKRYKSTRKDMLYRMKRYKRIDKAYNTRCSQAVTHPGTDLALLCLTSVIGREPVYS